MASMKIGYILKKIDNKTGAGEQKKRVIYVHTKEYRLSKAHLVYSIDNDLMFFVVIFQNFPSISQRNKIRGIYVW